MSYWNDGLYTKNDELYHFGIKGMKWGVRRYQNEDGSLTPAGKARYIKEMARDQSDFFKSKISKNAAKVTSIGRNGYDIRGQAWRDAYRTGKVTGQDDRQIKSAARDTRKYMLEKYGKSAVNELSKSAILGYKINDFEVKHKAEYGKQQVSSSFASTDEISRTNKQIKKAFYNNSKNNI